MIRAALIVMLASRLAAADPSDRTLALVGLAMAPPTYVIGVSLHEGSHAIAAELVGADVDEVHLFPPGIDPHVHVFRFGWTYVHGLHTRADRAWFYVAPKITDVALLGGFAALVLTGAWPHDRYAQLALTVGATGLWVDFAKDLVVFSPNDDIVKFFDVLCIRGWRQVPARIVYAAAAGGLALLVARGYERTFETPTMMLPIMSARF